MTKQNIAPTQFRFRRRSSRIIHMILTVLCVLMVVVPLMIFVNMSLKTKAEYRASSAWSLPVAPTLENYELFIRKGNLLNGFKNVIIMMIPSMLVGALMGSMVAYTVTRFRNRFTGALLKMYLVASIIPSITTSLSLFRLVKGLGIYNTHWAGILLFCGTSVIEVYMYVQYMDNISVELDESAQIDGANYFTIFFRVILPLLTPAIATGSIIKGINIYNDFFISMTYMPGKKTATVTRALMLFTDASDGDWSAYAAGIIVLLIPMLILYAFTQKYIVAGLTSGSIK